MNDYKITYDDVDLSPCCERGMTDYVFTIDPLGPATPETLAEVKSARRAEQRKAMKEWAAFWGAVLIGVVLLGAGSVVGNRLDVDVTDLWKFVPSLSGERVEPEESAK